MLAASVATGRATLGIGVESIRTFTTLPPRLPITYGTLRKRMDSLGEGRASPDGDYQ